MISDAAQNSRFEQSEENQRELLGKLEGLEAADVYLQVSFATKKNLRGKNDFFFGNNGVGKGAPPIFPNFQFLNWRVS